MFVHVPIQEFIPLTLARELISIQLTRKLLSLILIMNGSFSIVDEIVGFKQRGDYDSLILHEDMKIVLEYIKCSMHKTAAWACDPTNLAAIVKR